MYNAIVCKVHTRPHPNADKLLLGTAHGYQVVVGLDTADGELGVFFAADGQLSQEMCDANNLIGYTDPDTGEKKGGFFAKNRRVRAQKFRGEKSDGYWTSLDSFAWTGIDVSSLREGDQFEELNGHPVCNKYFTPATLRALKNGQKTSQKRENICFAKHVDTKQLKHEIGQIPEDSVIYITEKLHGTSGRFGYVFDEVPVPERPWWKKLLMFGIKKPEPKSEYKHLIGTRNVIMGDRTHEGYYGNEEFRWLAIEKLENNLHKGEVVYFELVGYTTTGATIMGQHHTSELKEIKKQYGDTIEYSYGQPAGTCGIYVYRITRTNEDGEAVELPWQTVKQRCGELGIKHVPDLEGPWLYSLFSSPQALLEKVESMLEGPSTLDDRHIREGVVIRVENSDTQFYKSKSFSFGVLEGYLKNSDDYVDTEEIA
jgi:hypothetical protein